MNVLIIEDELHTANLLKEIIEQDTDFMVVEQLEAVVDSIQYLSKHQNKLDLVFLDIQLADGQSFEIFKHVDITVPIIFCTAYDEYTFQAIKNNGIDYILKPFKKEEVHAALQGYKKLRQTLQSRQSTAIHIPTKQPKQYQKNFLTQSREKSIVKRVEEIALFAVESENVYLYTLEGKKFPLFKKLEYIESVCDPKQFFRINRQMLVNRVAIQSFEPYFNRKIILHLEIQIAEAPIVSRLKVSAFKSWLEQ